MIQPKISVVTVCYNAAATIEKTMLSVINQTYENIEYIIIDGGSTDGTVDIIKKYADRIAYWVSEPDKGIYDAMNKGIKVATGEWINFIGADDVFYKNNVITNMVSNMKERNVVYYGNVIFKGSGKIYLGKFTKIKWGTTNISHQAIFYPKSVYKAYVYNTQYKVYADYAYNLQLLKNNVKFKYINMIVTLYDVTGFSATNKDISFHKDYRKLVVDAVGWSAYFIGGCIRGLYKFKEKCKRIIQK